MTTLGRVLVVDDDRDIVESVSLRLRVAGYETLCAFDGLQGIAMATAEQPDAIVLDVRMPKMDGLTALAKMKQDSATKDIPIVMLSASLCDQQAALLAGASFFVVKPYVPNYLLAAVAAAIRNEIPAAVMPRRSAHVDSIATAALDDFNKTTPTIACPQRPS